MQSKFLSYLSVSPEQSEKLPDDLKQFVKLIDGSQELYAKAPEGVQKDKLGLILVQWTTAVMKYLKEQDLGIYVNKNVEREHANLPKQEEPPVKPQKPEERKPEPPQPPPPPPPTPPAPPKEEPPKPPKPKRRPKGGTPPPDGGTPPPPMPPRPEQKFTKQEVEDSLNVLRILAQGGDKEAADAIPSLEYLLATL